MILLGQGLQWVLLFLSGIFLFIIKFNGICLRPQIPRPNGNMAIHYPAETKPFPLNYHERTQMVLDPSENLLQIELDRFHRETTENNFVTNKKKTFVMVFNPSKKYTFSPQFKLGDSQILQTTSCHKILGLKIQSEQFTQMTKKASNTIWLLRRMKQLGIDEATITNYWKSEGRCHLEFCAPVWSGGITVAQARDLARVQRRAVAAITGSWREDYAAACSRLGIEEDLGSRRLQMCRTFAHKTATNSRHQDLFTQLDNPHQTRSGGRSGGSRPARPGAISSLPGRS